MGGDPEHSGGQVPDSGNAGDKSSQAPDPNKKPGKALADHRSRGWRALLSGGPSRALDLIRAGFVVETADAGVTYCLVSGADDADRTTSIRGILEEFSRNRQEIPFGCVETTGARRSTLDAIHLIRVSTSAHLPGPG